MAGPGLRVRLDFPRRDSHIRAASTPLAVVAIVGR
jgi:hypothetical protein